MAAYARSIVCRLTFVLSLWSQGVLAESPNVDNATAAQRAKAQEEYLAAHQHFTAGRYDEALAGFRKSYETVHSPNSHFMIARSLARLGRNVEAYAELTRVINEARALGDRYADTVRAAEAKQSDIRPRIALLTIRAAKMPEKTTFDVEGQSLSASDLSDPVPVLPGKVRVVAKLPDGTTVEQETQIITGEGATMDLEPAVPVEKKEEPAEVVVERSHIQKDGEHPRYVLELEGHGFYTTIEPPGPADQGFGPGLRLGLEVLRPGVIPGINDSVAIGAGVDYVTLAALDHLWFPVVLQWNLWIVPELSAFFEPGVAIMAARGEYLRPYIQGGARLFVVPDKVSITARAGTPTLSLGVSLFL